MQPVDSRINTSGLPADAAGLVARLGLRFGVVAGLVCAAWLLFLQWSGNNPFSPKQLMGLLTVPFIAAGSQWWLRQKLRPARPGVGRTLAVGGLTVVIAATLAAASAWGLAKTLGEPALVQNRRELVEITRVQQRLRDKAKRNAAFEQQELAQAAAITVGDLALQTFKLTLMLGFFLAVPSGIFLRK